LLAHTLASQRLEPNKFLLYTDDQSDGISKKQANYLESKLGKTTQILQTTTTRTARKATKKEMEKNQQ